MPPRYRREAAGSGGRGRPNTVSCRTFIALRRRASDGQDRALHVDVARRVHRGARGRARPRDSGSAASGCTTPSPLDEGGPGPRPAATTRSAPRCSPRRWPPARCSPAGARSSSPGGWNGDHHDGVPIIVLTRSAPPEPAPGHARYVTDVREAARAGQGGRRRPGRPAARRRGGAGVPAGRGARRDGAAGGAGAARAGTPAVRRHAARPRRARAGARARRARDAAPALPRAGGGLTDGASGWT